MQLDIARLRFGAKLVGAHPHRILRKREQSPVAAETHAVPSPKIPGIDEDH